MSVCISACLCDCAILFEDTSECSVIDLLDFSLQCLRSRYSCPVFD